MSKAAIPFWEEAYQDDNAVAFSIEPNATIKEFEHLLDKESRIIEAGCGEGQNVLYLTKQGYSHVEAFDLSEHAIGKIRRRCSTDGLTLNAFCADLTAYKIVARKI